MPESLASSKKLQWKWVGITFVLYLVFYILPIFVAGQLLKGTIQIIINGTWMFGGIIIVAAVAAYFSKGITIIEPAIASTLMFIFLFIIFIILVLFHPGARFDFKQEALSMSVFICIVFVLSLVGAWIGERAQKLRKTKSPE